MPYTTSLDETHSVTIRSGRRRGGTWEAQGEIFRTSTSKDIGISVSGEGDTMTQAEQKALSAARQRMRRHR